MLTEQRHKHTKNDILFILLSVANDNSTEGVTISRLQLCNKYTTRQQLVRYVDELVNKGLYSFDELTRRYKITRRGLYYLRSYAVTRMNIFE